MRFLRRQAGEPTPSVPSPFDDVPASRFFTDAVPGAYQNGLTTGKTLTEFAPDDLVTRVEFAAFLSRYDNLNLD